jgi:hypothetical protein
MNCGAQCLHESLLSKAGAYSITFYNEGLNSISNSLSGGRGLTQTGTATSTGYKVDAPMGYLQSYNLTVEQYRKNNLLKLEVSSKDVAELAAEMCGPLFAKTTAAQVPVDGGNERVV